MSVLALVDPTSRKYLQLERAVFERAIGPAGSPFGPGLCLGASPAPSRSSMSSVAGASTGSSSSAPGAAGTAPSASRVSPPRLEAQLSANGRSGSGVPAKGPSPDHETGPTETPLHVALFGTPPASSFTAASAHRVLPVVPYLGEFSPVRSTACPHIL